MDPRKMKNGGNLNFRMETVLMMVFPTKNQKYMPNLKRKIKSCPKRGKK